MCGLSTPGFGPFRCIAWARALLWAMLADLSVRDDAPNWFERADVKLTIFYFSTLQQLSKVATLWVLGAHVLVVIPLVCEIRFAELAVVWTLVVHQVRVQMGRQIL